MCRFLEMPRARRLERARSCGLSRGWHRLSFVSQVVAGLPLRMWLLLSARSLLSAAYTWTARPLHPPTQVSVPALIRSVSRACGRRCARSRIEPGGEGDRAKGEASCDTQGESVLVACGEDHSPPILFSTTALTDTCLCRTQSHDETSGSAERASATKIGPPLTSFVSRCALEISRTRKCIESSSWSIDAGGRDARHSRWC
ncbi:hypothetical protein C8R47DRAFT_313273 [Mycena vitilis]|nr:hypothetical protein C8R47DRAFT_313273 [Mycena vitilis]